MAFAGIIQEVSPNTRFKSLSEFLYSLIQHCCEVGYVRLAEGPHHRPCPVREGQFGAFTVA